MATSRPSTGTRAREITRLALEFLQDFSGDLPIPVKGVFSAAKRVIDIAEAIDTNREDCKTLSENVSRLTLVLNARLEKDTASRGASENADLPPELKRPFHVLKKQLNSIAKDLETLETSTDPKNIADRLLGLFMTKDAAATIQKCNKKLDEQMKEFKVALEIDNAIRLYHVQKDVGQIKGDVTRLVKNIDRSVLENLPRATSAAYPPKGSWEASTSIKSPGCLEGTRLDLLSKIREWRKRVDKDAPPIFWLNGMAGTGKSAIAYSVAGEACAEDTLGAGFRFARNSDAKLSSPAIVFTTLAYQLAHFDTVFADGIVKLLTENSDNAGGDLKTQWDRLIQGPLTRLTADPNRIVLIVLDALDECLDVPDKPGGPGVAKILDLILGSVGQFPFHLKFLITSRPELRIRSILRPEQDLQTVTIHSMASSSAKADIHLYLKAALGKIPQNLGLPFAASAEELDKLTDKAGELFVVAATYARFIGDSISRPRPRLEAILKSTPSKSLRFPQIDEIYTICLNAAIPDRFASDSEEEEFFSRLRTVFGMMICLREPLPISAIECLSGLGQYDIHASLNLLHSVIFVPPLKAEQDTPQFCHTSFLEFLCDDERCTDTRFLVREIEHQAGITLRCFELLKYFDVLDNATFDINRLNRESKRERYRNLPHEFLYACRHWATHFRGVSNNDGLVIQPLEWFLGHGLPHWLEAMALSDELDRAKNCMARVLEFNLAQSAAHAGLSPQAADQLEAAIAVLQPPTDVGMLASRVNKPALWNFPASMFDAYSRDGYQSSPRCTDGTRTRELEDVRWWRRDPDPRMPPIFWVMGISGIGKSTLVNSIAQEAAEEGTLGASFCFSRDGAAHLSDAKVVPTAIAYQLARYDPRFLEIITKVLQEDPYPHKDIKTQWENLVVAPLCNMSASPDRVVLIVLDALDECEARGICEIIDLILSSISKFPFLLRFIFSGRPEAHLYARLMSSPFVHTTSLHDIEATIARSDILLYLRAALREMPRSMGVPFSVLDDEVQELAEMAGPIFIVATTYIRFIGDRKTSDPRGRLNLVLSSLSHHESYTFRPLDAIYGLILKSTSPVSFASASDDTEFFFRLQTVLALVILLREPLPISSMERFAGLDEGDVREVLDPLNSIVSVPLPGMVHGVPRVYHQSLPDFLCDPERCTDVRFFIRVAERQTQFTMRCFWLLDHHINHKSHGSPESTVTSTQMPLEAQYACRRWDEHMRQAELSDGSVLRELGSFLFRSLLYWLEAMSQMGEMERAKDAISSTLDWVENAGASSDAVSLLQDTHHMLQEHSTTISQSTLDLYRSVIPSLSHDSVLYKQYAKLASECVASAL